MSLSKIVDEGANCHIATQHCAGSTYLCASDVNCKLPRKPLYCLAFFQLQVKASNWYVFNERRVDKTLEGLSWTDTHLEKLLLGLKVECFQKTVHDCAVHDLAGYNSIHGDQYEIHWDEENGTAKNSLHGASISLSLKIAIISDNQGISSGLVTIHPSGN